MRPAGLMPGACLRRRSGLASAANDERVAAHVLVQQQLLRLLHGEEGGTEEAARAVGRW